MIIVIITIIAIMLVLLIIMIIIIIIAIIIITLIPELRSLGVRECSSSCLLSLRPCSRLALRGRAARARRRSGRQQWQSMLQSYINKGIRRQGIGSVVRNSYVSTLCPVVICPNLCTSECSDSLEIRSREPPRTSALKPTTRGSPPLDNVSQLGESPRID